MHNSAMTHRARSHVEAEAKTPSSFSLFFSEAHQALELLEEYHAGLTRPSDEELRTAIERVISVFKDRLFLALLGKFYVLVLPARCHLRRVSER